MKPPHNPPDRQALLATIRDAPLPAAPPRPWLLADAAKLPDLRRRAQRLGQPFETARAAAQTLLATPPEAVAPLQPYVSSAQLATVAQAGALGPLPGLTAWLRARAFALLDVPTWFAPVHVGACRACDHCMCNTAAHLALAIDLAPDAFPPADAAAVAAGVGRLFLEPFLDGTADPCEWWFRPGMASNWKIMCCGDGGLAACSFADHWPHAREAMARAAQGVLDVLDSVPPEGDWGEGVGYWFATLHLGLRFAHALRRRSRGTLNLFHHPALQTTGDFLAQLTTPAGHVYNFADCDPGLSPILAEALAMLANAQDRPDWRHVARLAPAASPLYLSCEDGTAPAAPSPRRAAVFPTTGVATLRSGWQTEDLFAGLKSGPSTVGHSHLDANSFVLEAAGQPLVIEHPYWPQAHFLGFFDPAALRWNFDGPATVGHSTLLVDGQGQTWGDGRDGRILGAEAGAAWAMAVGEAADCYPGLLRQFTRTLLIAGRDTVVIRDVIRCEGERHIEWLLHYAGDIRSDGILSVIENAGVRLTVQPLLPDRGQGWRWSDVTRTSLYECSDTRQPVTRQVRYRSFSPFRRAAQVEFLFLLRVNPSGGDDGMAFSGEAGAWRLAVPGSGCTVAPCGDRLVCTPMP